MFIIIIINKIIYHLKRISNIQINNNMFIIKNNILAIINLKIYQEFFINILKIKYIYVLLSISFNFQNIYKKFLINFFINF